MAINFPDSPSNNDTYTDPVNGNRYIYDSANSAWKSASTFQYSVTISSTAPGSPQQGTLWWNQDYGRLLVYYQDANTSQWVDAAPADDKTVIFGVANGAFGKANTALQNTTGTFAGTLTVTANVIAANVGAGFTPPAGSYFVAGADIGRSLQVANDRVTNIRFDNNGLNYFYAKNLNVTAPGHGFGMNVKLGADGINEYNAGGFYALANGLYTSSATANAHIAFATTLQNNYNERMRITDTGYVGIGTTSPTSLLTLGSGGVMTFWRPTNDRYGTIYQDSNGLNVESNSYGDELYLKATSNTSGITFRTGGTTDKMRINPSGQVTMPYQPKFWINGSSGMTASTTASKMNFTGTQYDSANGWSDANDRYTVTVAGYWMFYTKVNPATSANNFYLIFRKNGSDDKNTYITGYSRQDLWLWSIVSMSVGDYMEVFTQTNTSTISVDNAGYFGGYFLG